MLNEIPEDLKGGTTQVTKVGGKVLRSRRKGSANVERLLTLLERRGFQYAPQFCGLTEDGRQVLTFIEGEAGNYPLSAALRSDEALMSAARTLRELHDATADLAMDMADGWMLDLVEPYEVICHGDFAPYNCIFDGSRLVGVIDFDTAHPGPRIRDVAYAIYRFAPLTSPDSAVGFGSLTEQARRARLFCEQYGEVDRTRVIDVLCQRLLELVDHMRAEAAKGDEAFQSHLDDGHDEAYLRDVSYLGANAAAFTKALTTATPHEA